MPEATTTFPFGLDPLTIVIVGVAIGTYGLRLGGLLLAERLPRRGPIAAGWSGFRESCCWRWWFRRCWTWDYRGWWRQVSRQ